MDAIDERISELVGTHRHELEQPVRQAVDRELERLIDAEFQRGRQRLLGDRGLRRDERSSHTKVCRSCEQRLQAEAEAAPPPPGRDHVR